MSNKNTNSEAQTLLNVLQFTTRILYPRYPHALFPLLSKLYVTYEYRKRKMASHLIRIVPEEIMVALIKTDNENNHVICPSQCVLIPSSTVKVLGSISGGWAKMRFAKHDPVSEGNEKGRRQEISQHSVVVQIFALKDLQFADEPYAIISDVLYYNMKKRHIVDMEKELNVVFSNIFMKPVVSGCSPKNFVPLVAKEAKIALVQSADDIASDILNDVLHLHFQIPRYLVKGFMFTVDLKYYAPLLNISENRPKMKALYFNVVELSGSDIEDLSPADDTYGYFVNQDVTTLIQTPNQHCYIPGKTLCIVNSSKKITARNYSSFMLNICPNGLSDHYKHLLGLLEPFLFPNKILEVNPMFLLYGPQGVGKREIVKNVASALGVNMLTVNGLHMQSSAAGYSEGKLKFIISRAKKCSPCILLLRKIEAIFKDKDGDDDQRVISTFHDEIVKLFSTSGALERTHPVLLIATTDTSKDTPSNVPPSIARSFLNAIQVPSPSEAQRASMLEWLLRKDAFVLDADVSVNQLAAQMSGFLFADIVALLTSAVSNRYRHLRAMLKSGPPAAQDVPEAELILRKQDFESALESMHAAYADAIGAPRIPAVSWKDVGGLSALKEEILRTITMPLRHPELTASGLRRSGLLLYGPPGTGKTLLAKAVATECNLNFLSVKGPELLNMYVGQSEENVREVFQRARCSAPCIIFFDELDSLAPNRGRNGDSGGVMDRVVSQLLAEMDGLQKSTQLFVIGATNRPDLIDPALLRPGRFDKLLYVGVCEDRESQLSVMIALTRKFHLKDDVKLEALVSRLPSNLTGADMYSLCSNAWMNAVKGYMKKHKEGSCPMPEHVEVSHADFKEALANIKPSVSTDDMRYFKSVHQEIVAH